MRPANPGGAPDALQAQVVEIVAEALDVSPDRVLPSSSLIDDLGAESIDFLDLVFRLESAFGIKIPEQEIWKGTIDPTDDASIAEGVRRLREQRPEFPWDRLPARLSREDLPRLITVQTVLDYVAGRLRAARGEGAAP